MSGDLSQDDEPSALDPDPVVVIRADEDTIRLALTLRAVLATTPSEVAIVVQSPRPPALEGFALAGRSVAHATELAPLPAADVVLLEAGVLPAEGWLAALTAVARGVAGIATASALVLDPALPAFSQDFAVAARAVAASALALHPRLVAPRGPCVFVKRSAVQLIVPAGLRGGQESWATFAERCVAAGLSHVLVDEVVVDGRASGAPVCTGDEPEPIQRVIGSARRALAGLSVTIDARVPPGRRDGTWVHVLELVAALGRTGEVAVTAIVSEQADDDLRTRLGSMAGVRVATLAEARASSRPRADVVHRPFQVSAPADLAALAPLAARLITTHQDLISFHNPSYFPTRGAWEGYRDLTRRALAGADHVVFFSEHVRREATGEDLVQAGRATVIPIGVDHVVTGEPTPPVAPSKAGPLGDATELLLCLGTDFGHKNRLFALRVLEALQRRHGWPGWLVLAGPSVAYGSSRPLERQYLEAKPSVARRVLDIGAASGPEKEWLLRRAALVVYPTVEEGFGLIPFEAAEHGVPCLWAATSALAENLPPAAAGIVPWDAEATADRAQVLLGAGSARAANVDAVRRAGAGLRWDETARRLAALYREACRQPPAPTAALERAGGLMRAGVSEDAMRLVGPGGSLPPELERPLLALTTHRRLAGPVLGLLRAGYAMSRRARRAERGSGAAKPD
jgi:glycosyltransferase involved in cell wall biosynthesis